MGGADYLSPIAVVLVINISGSQFAFALRQQQIRYFAVTPERTETIKEIEILKGPDRTAPVVMAVTVETR